MGIPYYFYTLTQKYKNILCSIKPTSTDIYCIDFNGIIHNSAQDIMKHQQGPQGPLQTEKLDNEAIETKIIECVWNKIEYYINTFNAKKYIICADGVAPVAKMFQQRKRRYLNVYRSKLDEGFATKPSWDTNAITPGTAFMNKLNLFIHKKIRYSTYNAEFIYSGSDENGEGEHKIFHKLKISPENSQIIIHGLDADLIILSLMSHHKNIHLMRETKDKESNETVYNYLNITNLRAAILKEITELWELKGVRGVGDRQYDDNDLIETYCTMCSILGNDFIPHLLTIDLKTDGINKLISATKKAIHEQDLLVSNGKINYECLKSIFKYLSKSEDTDIHNICEKYINKRIFNSSDIPSDYYALKNKDQLAYYIYNNPSKWHKEYYKEVFANNYTIDSTVMFNACDNYIIGIFWVYEYYKGNNIDCEWYYPYNYPPTIKDITNHAIAHEAPQINKNNNYVKPCVQLLIVLPRESSHLLKNDKKKYMTDIYSGLFHMYPLKYKIQTFLKTHLWECSPILPLINIKYINKVLSY
jgi:5'-3' exonuclease